jgi:hypothetical protein
MTVVVHLLGTLDRGGAETVVLGLCRAVSPTEYRQVFLTLGGRAGRFAGQFREAGATVEQLPLRPTLTFPCGCGVICAPTAHRWSCPMSAW